MDFHAYSCPILFCYICIYKFQLLMVRSWLLMIDLFFLAVSFPVFLGLACAKKLLIVHSRVFLVNSCVLVNSSIFFSLGSPGLPLGHPWHRKLWVRCWRRWDWLLPGLGQWIRTPGDRRGDTDGPARNDRFSSVYCNNPKDPKRSKGTLVIFVVGFYTSILAGR